MKVGIVAPMYNVEPFIVDFLESVRAQDYNAFTLYLHDDGSTDNTLSMTYDYVFDEDWPKEIDVCLSKETKNQGWAKAMNQVVSNAIEDKCELVFLANADDTLHPELLSATVGNIGDYDWLCMPVPTTDGIIHKPSIDAKWEDYLEQNKMTNFALIRTKMWQELGGYDVELFNGQGFEDWDFWLRAVKAGYKPTYLDRHLYLYRQHPAQTSRTVRTDAGEIIAAKNS